MKRVYTKKGDMIIEQYEKVLNESCTLYKGAPDARYANGYFIYATTWKGYAASGMYGQLIAHSKTLNGLLKLSELICDPTIAGVLSDDCLNV